VYHALHRKAESDSALRELTDKYARDGAFRIAECHAYRGDIDQAMHWLEQAHRNRDAGVADLLRSPFLRGDIARDPRYRAFLRKMNLPNPTLVGARG
jgi:eukaryotic-like serine/threonine-protein kinase